jgi:dienelactone hydrolase
MKFVRHTAHQTWISHLATTLLLALTGWMGLVSLSSAQTGMPGRIEYHVLPSQTVTGEEFLLGKKGKEVLLTGELRLPQGTTPKHPAVVLIHGSGGIGAAMDMWVHHFNQAGIATFVIDTFTGRGIISTVADQTQLHSLSMMVDAYRALDLLAKHPRIDTEKIAVMGFSKGALGSVFSASTRFKSAYGSNKTFAAHIGLYTPCNSRYLGDTELIGKPLRLFHGTTDDYVSVQPCRDYVKSLQAKGVDVTLTEFPDTEHAYDSPVLPKKLAFPTAQSTRNCQFTEKSAGIMINAQSGKEFNYQDPCVALGAHVGHNPDSTSKTVKAVLDFLKTM